MPIASHDNISEWESTTLPKTNMAPENDGFQ